MESATLRQGANREGQGGEKDGREWELGLGLVREGGE